MLNHLLHSAIVETTIWMLCEQSGQAGLGDSTLATGLLFPILQEHNKVTLSPISQISAWNLGMSPQPSSSQDSYEDQIHYKGGRAF